MGSCTLWGTVFACSILSAVAPVLTLAPYTSSMHARTHPYYNVMNNNSPASNKISDSKKGGGSFFGKAEKREI